MKVFIISSFVLCFVIKCAFGQEFILPEIEGFYAEGNLIYAFELCQRNNMTLPLLEDADKIARLTTLLEDNKIYRVWIGANDFGEEGKFRWLSTGQRVRHFVWHANQPDNSNNEDCVEFNKYQTTWAWNDLNCDTKITIVCEAHFNIDIRRLRIDENKNLA